jgi:LuxR family maltose regulon positive regulatory protein
MPSPGFLRVVEDALRSEIVEAASEIADASLNERELAILRLVATGASRREAAAQLYLSVNTVKTHLGSAYRKLGASTRDEAIERAGSLGMLDQAVSPGRPASAQR